LDIALPERNVGIAAITLDTVDRELRDLTEQFPDRRNSIVTGGVEERIRARDVLKYVVLSVHQISSAIQNSDFDEAAQGLSRSRAMLTAAVPVLQAGEPWSRFDRSTRTINYERQAVEGCDSINSRNQ
jgi:hypothetical protein